MPLTYSAFISYTSGWTEDYDKLIDAIQKRLEHQLQFYVRSPLWRYDKNEAPGAAVHETLRARICESVCMVVLYVPSYELSDTCVWEFVAMEEVEGSRLKILIPPLDQEYRMVIPIIIKKRRTQPLPNWITSRNYIDLTEYVTPDQSPLAALDDPRCIDKLERAAEAIGEVTRRLMNLDPDPCIGCPQRLPQPDDPRVNERWVGNRPHALPSRATG